MNFFETKQFMYWTKMITMTIFQYQLFNHDLLQGLSSPSYSIMPSMLNFVTLGSLVISHRQI